MMVPNRETIMKVKLASVGASIEACGAHFIFISHASHAGYSGFELLGKKFCILYALCEQQLSKQRLPGSPYLCYNGSSRLGTTTSACETS